MSETPRLQRNDRTGEYRAVFDDGRTMPARVQENARTGARRWSIDDGKTWTASTAPEFENEDQTVEGGTVAAFERLPDDPAKWSVRDAADARAILKSGNTMGQGEWLKSALDTWTKSGRKTGDNGPSASPTPATPSPAAPAAQEPAKDLGFWGHLAGAGKSFTVPDTVKDFAQGAGQGYTFSRGDEASAAVESMLPGTGAPRAAGRGLHAPLMTPGQEQEARYKEALASNRQDIATAEQRSPWATLAGRAYGMAPAAIATAPVFGVGTGGALGAQAVRAGVQSGVMGAVDASGRDVDARGGERLADAGKGGIAGAAGGVAGTYIGAGGGALLKKGGELGQKAWSALADKAQKAGWRNRAAASGVYGGELAAMTKEEIKRGGVTEGRKLAEKMGETIERYGAHKRPESSWLPSWVPQSASTYADTLETATKQAGRNIGQAVDDATAAGTRIEPAQMAAALRNKQADQLAAGAADVAEGVDAAAADLAAKQAGRAGVSPEAAARMGMEPSPPAGPYTPREAWNLRHSWKKPANLDAHKNVTPEGTARAQGYREARDAIDETIQGAMTPEQLAQYQAGNRDYGRLRSALNASVKREAQELGNQIASVSTPSAAAAGAVMAGAPGAAATITAGEAFKRFGRDAVADTMGGTAAAARRMAAASDAVRQAGAAVEPSAAGAPSGIWSSLALSGKAAQPSLAPAFAEEEAAALEALEEEDEAR